MYLVYVQCVFEVCLLVCVLCEVCTCVYLICVMCEVYVFGIRMHCSYVWCTQCTYICMYCTYMQFLWLLQCKL